MATTKTGGNATQSGRPAMGTGSPKTLEERLAEGRRLRQQVPRSSHAAWSPPADRVDPIAMLQAEERNRLPELVPVRYGRMVTSPFTFYRATAALMASDLATTPVSGLTVQASGDAHLSNFGGFATPERTLVFDLNDFDETLPGPWEWDVKRLAASAVLAGRANGFTADECATADCGAVRSYRERMAEYVPMGYLAVWYSRITAAEATGGMPKDIQKTSARWAKRATSRDHLQSFTKMTTLVDGRIRIADAPPLIVRGSDEVVGDNLRTFAKTYRSTLRDDVSALLQRYTFVDFALKVVGVGAGIVYRQEPVWLPWAARRPGTAGDPGRERHLFGMGPA